MLRRTHRERHFTSCMSSSEIVEFHNDMLRKSQKEILVRQERKLAIMGKQDDKEMKDMAIIAKVTARLFHHVITVPVISQFLTPPLLLSHP